MIVAVAVMLADVLEVALGLLLVIVDSCAKTNWNATSCESVTNTNKVLSRCPTANFEYELDSMPVRASGVRSSVGAWK